MNLLLKEMLPVPPLTGAVVIMEKSLMDRYKNSDGLFDDIGNLNEFGKCNPLNGDFMFDYCSRLRLLLEFELVCVSTHFSSHY